MYKSILTFQVAFSCVIPIAVVSSFSPGATTQLTPNRQKLRNKEINNKHNNFSTTYSCPFSPLTKNSSTVIKITRTNTRLNMCQLLGMNCATPTDFVFSFSGFRQRGGLTDKHSDGWGCIFYEGRGVRAFHDSSPAAESPIADLISNYPIKTLNMLAHIRYATTGAVALENVHPFQREMWGIIFSFAHNGDVPKFGKDRMHPWIGDVCGEKTYNPVGDTDSEAVFCAILNALHAKFKTLPTMPVLYDAIAALCKEIVTDTCGSTEEDSRNPDDPPIFNMLLGVGQHVQFAYSWPGARPGSTCWNGLCYTVRKPPFATAKLSDMDYSVDFNAVTTESDCVAVIATTPLTNNEQWVEFERGELVLFDNGLPHSAIDDIARVEEKGHGLQSRVLQKLPLPKAAADFHTWYGGAKNRRAIDDVSNNFVI
mmetsp:Transcript_8626/g.12733  ORF Transcript_8626/g.12733 Transcript_8626/m.12733 type:complete len:425 (-) Transcript_8626:121-1395(-)